MRNIYKKLRAFTFVELIIGMWLSVMLMLVVSLFVSDGISNVFKQKNNLDNLSELNNLNINFIKNFEKIDSSVFVNSTWALLKLNWWAWSNNFFYLWEKTYNNYYCSTWDYSNTKHLFIKNIVWYEDLWSDLFLDNINSELWGYKVSFSSGKAYNWSIAFSGGFAWLVWLSLWSWNDLYVSDSIANIVYKLDKSDLSSKAEEIVWNWIFGNTFSSWSTWTWISLNMPTGLAYGDNTLFISDTLNNRILYYVSGKVYKLLDEYDGISKPMWLYFDTLNDRLFISNTWKNEIIIMQDKVLSSPDLDINLSSREDISWIVKMRVEFLTWSISLNTGNTINDYTFSNISKNSENYLTWSSNYLDYYFSDFSSLDLSDWPKEIIWCSDNTSYFFDWLTLKKRQVSCSTSATWTIREYSGYDSKTFLKDSIYWLNISNINSSDLSGVWSFYVKIWLYNSFDNLVYTDYFPYYISWDSDIKSIENNTIKSLTWFTFPSWISFFSPNIIFNDFIERKRKTIDLDWNLVSEVSLSSFDFEKLAYNKNSDYIFPYPIESLDIDYSDNILSIFIKYYKNYSCLDDGENIVWEYIFKKYIK